MNDLRKSTMGPSASSDYIQPKCDHSKTILEKDAGSPTMGSFVLITNVISLVHRLLQNNCQPTEDKSVCPTCRQGKDKQSKEMVNGLQEIDRQLRQYCQIYPSSGNSCENPNTHILQQQLQQESNECNRLRGLIKETKEQMEHLGAQLIAYKEDFENERADRERAHGMIADVRKECQQLQQRHEAEKKELHQQLRAANQKLEQLQQKMAKQRHEEELPEQVYLNGVVNIYPTASTKSHKSVKQVAPARDYSPMRCRFDDIEIDGKVIMAPPAPSRTAPITASSCAASANQSANQTSWSDGKYVKTSGTVPGNYAKTSCIANSSASADYRRSSALDNTSVRRNENAESSYDTLVARSGSSAGLYQTDSYHEIEKSDRPLYETDGGVDETDGERVLTPTHHALGMISGCNTLTAREVFNSNRADLDIDAGLPYLQTDGYSRGFGFNSIPCDDASDSVCISSDLTSGNLDLHAESSEEYNWQVYKESSDRNTDLDDLSIELKDEVDGLPVNGRREEVSRTLPADMLQCPRCHKAYSIEQHHLLLDHMEYVCMQ